MVQMSRSFQCWQLSKSSVPERFKELLTLSQWTDCAFSFGSEDSLEIVKCHKLVLAVSSPVFEAMFYGDLATSTDVINITDIDSHSFKLFLRYVYSDILDLTNIDEAGSLLYIGKKYILPHLSKVCLDYLKEHTYLQNLWDILSLAESLGEDSLIEPCLKVMSRHPPEIWLADGEHLSKNVFCQFLEQPQMIISEFDLWLFAVQWVEEECLRRNLEISNENKRTILLECSVPDKLRFHLLKEEEMERVVNSGLVTSGDKLLKTSLKTGALERVKPFEVRLKSSRDIIRRGNIEYCSGQLVTKVASTGRILVRGFEVFTRAAKTNSSYREQFTVTVKAPDGTLLNRTKCAPSSCVLFNSEYEVLLSQPLWFEPFSEYTVVFHVNGLYQVCDCTETSMAKVSLSTFFKFIDPCINGQVNGLAKLSYITGVLFSL